MVLAIAIGTNGVTDTVTFGLAAFALAGIVRQVAVGARARRQANAESWPTATVYAVRSNPRLYGGLIVHTGIVLIAVALVASSSYSTRREVRVERGESVTVAGYEITYLGSRKTTTDQKTTVEARVRLAVDGEDLGVYTPAISSFPGRTSGIGTPDVREGLVRDVYLTLVSSPTERDRVTIGVAVNPMIVWLWIGGGVVALGTLVALLPSLRRRSRRDPVPEPTAETPRTTRSLEEVPV
jgi:cytochrome c-type biogenesis protein CcmF